MEKFEWENVYAWVLKHKKILIIAALVVVGIALNYFFSVDVVPVS